MIRSCRSLFSSGAALWCDSVLIRIRSYSDQNLIQNLTRAHVSLMSMSSGTSHRALRKPQTGSPHPGEWSTGCSPRDLTELSE
jgi:hypothetical protein